MTDGENPEPEEGLGPAPGRTPGQRTRWLLATAGVVLITGLGAIYYGHLPEPKHVLPRSAEDWSAWGTWAGAAFTGGALIFAGRQFSTQTRALSLEVNEQRAARKRESLRRLAFGKQALIATNSSHDDEILSASVPGTDSGGELNSFTPGYVCEATWVAPPGGLVVDLRLHFGGPLLEPATEANSESWLQVDHASRRTKEVARLPVITWKDRLKAPETRSLSKLRTVLNVDGLSSNSASARIHSIKPGEAISVVFTSPQDLSGLLAFTFADEHGNWFRHSADGQVEEIAEPR